MYLRYIPKWARLFLPDAVYDFKSEDNNCIYLTFDDGPVPEVTEFVLKVLEKYDAKATFFCVGDNVRKYPDVYSRIVDGGHKTGNHTFNHLDGYRTRPAKYYKNVLEAGKYIQSPLFRPPYGHITYRQARSLQKKGFRLVMWSLLTADFDVKLDKNNMWAYVRNNIEAGDILVLHDNIKSFEKLKFVLPLILDWGQKKGWQFRSIQSYG